MPSNGVEVVDCPVMPPWNLSPFFRLNTEKIGHKIAIAVEKLSRLAPSETARRVDESVEMRGPKTQENELW